MTEQETANSSNKWRLVDWLITIGAAESAATALLGSFYLADGRLETAWWMVATQALATLAVGVGATKIFRSMSRVRSE